MGSRHVRNGAAVFILGTKKGSGKRKLLGEIFRKRGGVCFYCKRDCRYPQAGELSKSAPADVATIDHIIPVSRGGTSHFRNLALACRDCNNKKADKDETLFREEIKSGLVQVGPKKRKKKYEGLEEVPASRKESLKAPEWAKAEEFPWKPFGVGTEGKSEEGGEDPQ